MPDVFTALAAADDDPARRALIRRLADDWIRLATGRPVRDVMLDELARQALDACGIKPWRLGLAPRPRWRRWLDPFTRARFWLVFHPIRQQGSLMRHCRPCGQPAEECWCLDDDDEDGTPAGVTSLNDHRAARYRLPPVPDDAYPPDATPLGTNEET